MALVARSLLRVKVLRLPRLAAADRRAAIRTELMAWQPFASPSIWVGEAGDYALALAWDSAAVAAKLRLAGQDPSSIRLVPETCMRVPAAREGWRLVSGLDGFDAECWQGGLLRHSRWWPQQPDEEQWQQSLRQLSAEPAALPDVVTLAGVMARQPWISLRPLAEDGGTHTSAMEVRLVQAACILAAGVTGVLAHQAIDAFNGRAAVEAELASASSAAQQVARVRDEAYAIRAIIERVSGHLSAPLAAEVIQHLSTLLPKGVEVQELDLAGRTLRIVMSIPQATPRSTIVKLLQEGGWFADVREIRSTGTASALAVEMQFKGAVPPARPASGAALPASAPAAPMSFPLPGGAPAPTPGAAPKR